MKKYNYPSVSIIFPVYNGGDEPIECLDSVNKLNYPKKKMAVIVVDNGSIDNSTKQIAKKYPLVKIIKNQQNLGFAKAINQALKQASKDYVFITNDDIVFEKDSLKNLILYSQNNPQSGILGGLIYKKGTKGEISSAGNELNHLTGNIYSSPSPDKIKEPGWIQGCAMLVKRDVIKKIGLLDDKFTYSFEDVDYCTRAKRAGFKIVYIPSAVFWHRVSATANRNRKLTHYQWYQSKLRYALKNLPTINVFSILLFQTLIIFYKTVASRDHRLIPYIKAVIWNLNNLPQTLKYRNAQT